MIFALLSAATLWCIALLFLVSLARRAPVGFEGEEGLVIAGRNRRSARRKHEVAHGVLAHGIFGS
jgi:hypothetical protein